MILNIVEDVINIKLTCEKVFVVVKKRLCPQEKKPKRCRKIKEKVPLGVADVINSEKKSSGRFSGTRRISLNNSNSSGERLSCASAG